MKNNLKIKLKKQNAKRQSRAFIRKIAIIMIAFISCSMYAQDEKEVSQINGNNELKINGLFWVLGVGEITYERLISDESSLGLSVSFDLGGDDYYKFAAVPYYRFFFGKKRASGFFIEGNGAIISDQFGDELTIVSNNGSLQLETTPVKTRFGIGLGFGGKFITKNGWIGEISTGIGRMFGFENDNFRFYTRGGITIGKRF